MSMDVDLKDTDDCKCGHEYLVHFAYDEFTLECGMIECLCPTFQLNNLSYLEKRYEQNHRS